MRWLLGLRAGGWGLQAKGARTILMLQVRVQLKAFTQKLGEWRCHAWPVAQQAQFVNAIMAVTFWSQDDRTKLACMVTKPPAGAPSSGPRSQWAPSQGVNAWADKMQDFSQIHHWMPMTFWEEASEDAAQGALDTHKMGRAFMTRALQLGARHPREYLFRNAACCECALKGGNPDYDVAKPICQSYKMIFGTLVREWGEPELHLRRLPLPEEFKAQWPEHVKTLCPGDKDAIECPVEATKFWAW